MYASALLQLLLLRAAPQPSAAHHIWLSTLLSPYVCADWPHLVIFALPAWAESYGAGAQRFCIKRLATAICPRDFPYALVLDDNVHYFYRYVLRSDPCFKEVAQRNTISKFDTSFWEVLSHFQKPEFTELDQFAALGFHRVRRTDCMRAPFVRGHFYKAALLNLAKLRAIDYDPCLFYVEDIEFHKRMLCQCQGPDLCKPARMGGTCCSIPRDVSGDMSGDTSAAATEAAPPLVMCKYERFAMKQKSLAGGMAALEEETGGIETSWRPSSVSIGPWLRSLPWGARGEDQVELVVQAFEKHGRFGLNELLRKFGNGLSPLPFCRWLVDELGLEHRTAIMAFTAVKAAARA